MSFPGKKKVVSEANVSTKELAPEDPKIHGEVKAHPFASRAPSALEIAQNAFIDGPVARVGKAFITLYCSDRNPAGDSPHAIEALDAVRAAFDACGLILADVDTRPSVKLPIKSKSIAMVAAAAKAKKAASKKKAPVKKKAKK